MKRNLLIAPAVACPHCGSHVDLEEIDVEVICPWCGHYGFTFRVEKRIIIQEKEATE